MASKQKRKGSALERDVAKDLSQRYNENFIRTIGSGSYVGGVNASRKDVLTESQTRSHKGDVTPPETFHFMNMECKSYKDFNFHQLFSQNCPLLDSWIEQCLEPADEDDINVIVIKISYQGSYVCIERHNDIDNNRGLLYNNWVFFDYDVFFEDNEQVFSDVCRNGKLDESK